MADHGGPRRELLPSPTVTATRAGRCLALALAGLPAWSGPARGAGTAAAEGPTSTESTTEPAAKAALRRAREAARARDYATALRHFEEALRLQPSAKLHFNVGVCHHRLMMDHPPGSPAYEQQRGAAVAAYNRYLQAAPDAADHAEVSEMIRALGGTPLSEADPEPWTIELVEPDDVPDPPGLSDDDGGSESSSETPADAPTDAVADAPTDAPPKPPPDEPPPPRLRGRFGVVLPVVLSNPAELAASDELRPLPGVGLGLRGNAFLGPRRRIALGGELVVTLQPASARTRHRLATSTLGLLLEVRHPLGDGRFEIGGGGVLGLGTQSLTYRGPDRLRCAAGREASRRTGLWAGARLYLAALLGPRRNHELSLRLGPGLGAYAAGTRADEDANGNPCTDEPSAFETFGIDEGAALVVSVDIGYAPRF